MKHDKTLYLALTLTGLLAGCSTTNLGLNPTVPEQAGGSISKAAIRLKDAECQKKPERDRPTCKAETYGLDEVKLAFDSLYDGTRNASNSKNKQEWAYGEVASTGGFGAVVGQLASQTALLNSGIALATVGLSMDSFYKPGTTKATHLRAEVMFQCLQRELTYVTEVERVDGERAEVADGHKQAASAVRDAVEQIDAAITLYRRSVLTQVVAIPQNSDFSRFVKTYATETKAGDDALAKAAATTDKAEKEKNAADAEKAVAQERLAKAETKNARLASQKVQSLQSGATPTGKEAKALDGEIDNAAKELEESKVAEANAKNRFKAAEADLATAKATASAAKFVAFKVNLETCVRGFGA
jgi:hypothetical protein